MIENPNKFGRVAVLMGGVSAERDVSLRSGAAVLAALRHKGVNATGIDVTPENLVDSLGQGFDRAFNILHGRWGEDGVVQGVLDTLSLPYTGSGVLGSALAMDKIRTKQVWQAIGLATPKFKVIKNANDLPGLVRALGLPLFLKPSREGSSVGVGKVLQERDLESAYRATAAIGDEVIAEQFMAGAELTVGILGGDALPVVRMSAAGEFYDYQAKYESNTTEYFCPAGLSPQLEQEVRQLAVAAFDAVGCRHWGRVDVMLNDQDQPMLLEVNPIPGMTDLSLVPMAAAEIGLSFADLVWQILEGTL